ncbi:MAG: nucleotidyltransferase domain-containing protein [Candidatus Yanofskybacteria bacterium]|nr:nucleotidyltransferase domain-containing protein [Candidatus Yanofskybacteria bacterium]
MDENAVEKIKSIFAENDIEYAAIFGSRARGDNRPDSDLDILVRFKKDKEPGLFGYIALERKLSEALKQKVDLVTQEAISPYIEEYITKDIKVIYQ